MQSPTPAPNGFSGGHFAAVLFGDIGGKCAEHGVDIIPKMTGADLPFRRLICFVEKRGICKRVPAQIVKIYSDVLPRGQNRLIVSKHLAR